MSSGNLASDLSPLTSSANKKTLKPSGLRVVVCFACVPNSTPRHAADNNAGRNNLDIDDDVCWDQVLCVGQHGKFGLKFRINLPKSTRPEAGSQLAVFVGQVNLKF
jgi:hypothetical protein